MMLMRRVQGALVVGLCGWASVGAVAQSANDSWRRVAPGLDTAFPAAHRCHPDYRVEWWYYTGNLAATDGRRIGFQLTFFRLGVDFEPLNPSRWAVRDLHVAHLAVTDVDREMFRYAERVNRAGIGVAGAATDRYDVWNAGWRATVDSAGRHRLVALGDDLGIDLTLVESRAPVWHGQQGYSQKGSEPGNATQYYSVTRMRTVGRVMVEGEWTEVDGVSWMDHEYGTSFLEPGQIGWDWFSVQLVNGDDLMVFQLRRTDGRPDPGSAGTVVRRDGSVTRLDAGAFRMEPLVWWTSPASGARYPVRWRVSVPEYGLLLDVRAAVESQELDTSATTGVTYWEGVIRVDGRADGIDVEGAGYLEMTGYAGPPMSSILR